MVYVYEGMYRASLGIKKLFNHNKGLYKLYINTIKQRWDEQLHKNIYLVAYWLNPCFQYDHENFFNKLEVIGGMMDVIDKKVIKRKNKVMNELKLYREQMESFGRELAYSSC